MGAGPGGLKSGDIMPLAGACRPRRAGLGPADPRTADPAATGSCGFARGVQAASTPGLSPK